MPVRIYQELGPMKKLTAVSNCTGHTTWADYYNMVRIFKKYDFPLRAKQTTAKSTLFPSYPAFVSSVDDFYQLSSGLVVIETTNGITNPALFKLIKPQAVMSWIRVSVRHQPYAVMPRSRSYSLSSCHPYLPGCE